MVTLARPLDAPRALRLVPVVCALLLGVSTAAVPPTTAAASADEELPESVRPAPTRPAPHHAIHLDTTEPASTGAGARVLARLAEIRETLRATRYQHRTRVRASRGEYFWDCSGMTTWILDRSARRVVRGIHRERPVARSYYAAIERAGTERPRAGIRRLERITDGRPGDLFAWLRPADWGPGATGHVGFLLSRPQPVPEWPDAYVVRVADATSFGHQDDTRPRGSEGGYGEGTLLFTTDGHGNATGYGWLGRYSNYVVSTPALFGRLSDR